MLYRGYSNDFKNWVYGSYFEYMKIMPPPFGRTNSKNIDYCIIKNGFADWNLPTKPQFIKVDPDSVGLFSGLLTNDGKKNRLFSGDIVEISDVETGKVLYRGVIQYFLQDKYPAFDIDLKYIPTDYSYDTNVLSEILNGGYETISRVGNVYETPKLDVKLNIK